MTTGSQPEPEAKRRQPVDDEFKIRLAIERYSGDGVEVRELAEKYGRAEAVISRAISSAFRENLVEVRPVPKSPLRLAELEKALRRKYPTLRSAVVVGVATEDRDDIQEQLGHALAEYVNDGWAPDHVRLIVGAGRCVFHTAERLRQSTPKLRAVEPAVLSACGSSYPFHDHTRNVCLDADANTNVFSQAFEDETKMGLTSCHALRGDKGRKADYYKSVWTPTPTHAILGVGVVDHRHQLYLLTDQESSKNFPPVSIPQHLSELVSKMFVRLRALNSSSANLIHGVAEIAMHLYAFAYSPAGGADAVVPDLALTELVTHLNVELFCPTLAQLQQVGTVAIVGGGSDKTEAIRYLLGTLADQTKLKIHVLCTDNHTAEALIR